MKPSSFGRLAIAAGLCLLFTAFTPQRSFSPKVFVSQTSVHYYYYLADDDSYDSYSTVSEEIIRMQTLYGVLVNTNPFGGTLVALGYLNNAYPHNIWPSSYLYAHF